MGQQGENTTINMYADYTSEIYEKDIKSQEILKTTPFCGLSVQHTQNSRLLSVFTLYLFLLSVLTSNVQLLLLELKRIFELLLRIPK